MAATSSSSGIKSEARDKNGLCLLSLDGGGVRGLSTLLILKGIMQRINTQRQRDGLSPAKPCDVFDLIGGTSTGGLIAIMLGRLQMDIQPCIDAYSELSSRVFCKAGIPVDWRGKVKGSYSASALEAAVKKIIRDSGLAEDALLDDGEDRSCRVFVCAVRKENKAVARIRAYQSNRALVEDRAKIWEAARATSAASGFFDPITIGKHGQEYVDAGLGCNNPVDEVWTEAQDIWSPNGDDLAALVRCFISIGTGNPGTSPVEDSVWKMFSKTLTAIVTETERTAETFQRKHRGLFDRQRCFRFNVDQGLQNVGLEEYQKRKEIVSATSEYMESQRMQAPMRKCAEAMGDKDFWRQHQQGREQFQLVFSLTGAPEIDYFVGREQFQLVFSLTGAPEIDYFVGRASNLASIESELLPFTVAKRKLVVLHGLGGIGKSQLAIEFAKKHRCDYTAVFWLNAKTEDTLKRSFAANARRLPKESFNQELLDRPQDEEALRTILREMKTWLGLAGNDRWLLVYDNVDNPKIPDNKSENAFEIRSYFPEAYQGSILVTTRWKPLRIGHPLEIAKLSKDEESLSLLTRMSGRAIGEDPGTEDLLRKLDGLPLALATAGGFLRETGIPVSDYLDHYNRSWLELQRKSPHILSYEDQTIHSTWNLSYMHIRNENESAAKLLELWAYFDNRDLWYDLMKAGEYNAPEWFLEIVHTKLDFTTTLGTLQKHALVEHLTDSDGYSMHHCVHAWVANVLCTASESQNLMLALGCVGYEEASDWATRTRLLPHAERCSQLLHVWTEANEDSEEMDDCVIRFYPHLANLYSDLEKLDEAELMCRQALQALARRSKALESDHARTLDAIYSLSDVLRRQKNFAEAESTLQQALIDNGNVLDPDHTSVLISMVVLGNIYCDQGKLIEAESMFQRALTGQEKILGSNHLSTLKTMSNLGIAFVKQGKLTKAESIFQQALTGQEKVLRQNHSDTLNTMISLGSTFLNQGKLAVTESMLRQALTGQEKILGKNHSETLNTMSNLGFTYLRQGKQAEAESMFQRALTGQEKILGSNHLSTLRTISDLGLTYFHQGKLTEAESMFQRALTGQEKILGSNHLSTLRTMSHLGLTYLNQGKLAVAESMFQQVLTGREKVLGQNHPDTLNTISGLGSIFLNQGKLAEADSMFQRALAGCNEMASPNTPLELSLFYNMGLLSRGFQHFERAKEFFTQAYEGRAQLLGSQHPNTIKALEELNIEIERNTKGKKSRWADKLRENNSIFSIWPRRRSHWTGRIPVREVAGSHEGASSRGVRK